MTNRLRFSLSVLAFLTAQASFAINPDQLMKVTPENNPKCVEYYQYKNEMYCSTAALSTDKPDPNFKNYEKQKIVFDDRIWQAVWGKQTPTITTVEYVPAGDNIDAWHELVTSQFIPGVQNKITPKEYSKMIIGNIEESGFNPIVKYFEETPGQVIFEFRIEAPANLKQDDLQIVKRGKDGFYILHYTIKEADMGDKIREQWIKNLKASTIK